MTVTPRHFLDLAEMSNDALRAILDHARFVKDRQRVGESHTPLAGKTLAMVFEKPSTRTRVSFEVGMRQLGGDTVVLTGAEMQLGRSETIADTAKVLSRYVDIIMVRTLEHERLLELADAATVPVINGLTDDTHPCQIMADILTFEEHRGPVKGKKFAWTGDGNNVTHSLIEGAARFGYSLSIATPAGSEPQQRFVDWARGQGATVELTDDPQKAADDADCIVTDTWVSMNQEHRARGNNVFQRYQVNADLMNRAKNDALFMHCLPAHRGEEVTDEVMDGSQSVVFDEAENRMHAQKAVLHWCLGGVA
ncbi:ornithine carbamoyltransferase [Notoacmeibacter marinus]|uniref:ornithine carbamoyltransferase n=1 Tax=Notoacmeibacter marinus TaxID=1876515 RepID=UPI000DF3ECFF